MGPHPNFGLGVQSDDATNTENVGEGYYLMRLWGEKGQASQAGLKVA